MIKITTHTLVKNEDSFIYYALKAWESRAFEMLVYDDNSTDKTVEKINSLNSSKIKLKEFKAARSGDITKARNEMLLETKTDWFLILDGDEVWSDKTIDEFLEFLEKQPKNIWAVGMRTKNAIGDVFHYLDDSSGRYKILDKVGHLNIRAYKKLPGFSWQGNYPIEYYGDTSGNSINGQNNHLAFFEGHYFHFTNLSRSSKPRNSLGRRSVLWEKGTKSNELPDVMHGKKFKKRGLIYELMAKALMPVKHVKKHLVK